MALNYGAKEGSAKNVVQPSLTFTFRLAFGLQSMRGSEKPALNAGTPLRSPCKVRLLLGEYNNFGLGELEC